MKLFHFLECPLIELDDGPVPLLYSNIVTDMFGQLSFAVEPSVCDLAVGHVIRDGK